VPRLDLAFTDRARIEIAEIDLYSRLMWGDEQADEYLDDLHRAFTVLLRYPESAPLTEVAGENQDEGGP
jgi:plasmid stabilization system protein ParE